MTKFIIILFFCFSAVMMFVSSPRQKRHKNIWLYVLVLSLVAALRPDTMPDYENYVSAVENSNSYDSNRFEFTFNVIKWIAHSDYLALFFIYALISVSIRICQIKKLSPVLWGSMLIYISYIFVLHDMIQIRAAVASALLLVIIPHIYNRNWKAFLFLTFIAISFHYSAIIFLLLWFINPRKYKPSIYILALLLSYCLALLGTTVTSLISYIPFEPIQLLYTSYSSKVDDYVNIFNALQLGRCCLCVFLWYKASFVNARYKYYITLLKIYTLGLCALPLFSDIVALAVRVSQLLLSIEMILIPVGFIYMFRQKIFAKVSILLYAFVLLFFTLSNTMYWNP